MNSQHSLKIKIHGQKRCGTNLVEHILKKAGHTVYVNQYGWKHGPVQPDILDHVDRVVICARNPAAWLVSNRKHDAKIEKWVEDQGLEGRKNRGWGAEDRWTTLEEWAAREGEYAEWISENRSKATSLDTMAFITSPVLAMEYLVSERLIPAPQTIPKNKMSMNAMTEKHVFNDEYYRQQKYLDELSSGDWELMERVLGTNPHLDYAWGAWFTQVRRK